MKVYQGPENTSVLEFHNVYGSFTDYNQITKDIKEQIDEIEATLYGEEKDEEEKEEEEDN